MTKSKILPIWFYLLQFAHLSVANKITKRFKLTSSHETKIITNASSDIRFEFRRNSCVQKTTHRETKSFRKFFFVIDFGFIQIYHELSLSLSIPLNRFHFRSAILSAFSFWLLNTQLILNK